MDWHLAQLNIAMGLYPIDDPRMGDFVAQLDAINALADGSPGFVWRLQSDSGNATDIDVGDDPKLLVNMSVWTDVEALKGFAYRSAHAGVVAERRRWFERPTQAYQVLWWVPAGHVPSVEEGMARLARLRADGPGQEAFDFKHVHAAPAAMGEGVNA